MTSVLLQEMVNKKRENMPTQQNIIITIATLIRSLFRKEYKGTHFLFVSQDNECIF